MFVFPSDIYNIKMDNVTAPQKSRSLVNGPKLQTMKVLTDISHIMISFFFPVVNIVKWCSLVSFRDKEYLVRLRKTCFGLKEFNLP